MEAAFSDNIYMLVHTVLTGLCSAALMFVLDWRTAIILILLGILSAYANCRFAGPIRRIGKSLQENLSVMNERLSDIINGFYTIKLYNISNIIKGKFDEENNNVLKVHIKAAKIVGAQIGVNFLISWVNFGGIMLIGAVMAIFGSISFGNLAANVQLLNGVTAMFLQTGMFYAALQSSLAGASRVFEILDMPTEGVITENFECLQEGFENTQEEIGKIPDVKFAERTYFS
jgi:ATP-binding cassette subfamily B protein